MPDQIFVILSGEGPNMQFVEVENEQGQSQGHGVRVNIEPYPGHEGLSRLGPFYLRESPVTQAVEQAVGLKCGDCGSADFKPYNPETNTAVCANCGQFKQLNLCHYSKPECSTDGQWVASVWQCNNHF